MIFSSSSQNVVPVNHFPRWVYGLILAVVIFAVIYALPMIYGESPSIQLTPKSGIQFNAMTVQKAEEALSPLKDAFGTSKEALRPIEALCL